MSKQIPTVVQVADLQIQAVVLTLVAQAI